ncbi:MAG: pilus assembly protein TadB [Clostridia bacterium]
MEKDLTDYSEYHMTIKEKILYTFLAMIVIFVIVFIFYHKISISLILCTTALIYPKIKRKEIIEKRKYSLNLQFKDMLYSLSSSLNAGKSVELSFREIHQDLSVIYIDPNTDILIETQVILRKLKMNETIESALTDFSNRAHIEDITNFVDVFNICKRTGGNIIEIIKNTSNIINDKIEKKEEINIILSERKLEQKILTSLPVFMVILLTFTVPEYIAPVFKDSKGIVAMTVSIVFLLIAYVISKKIVSIIV